MENSHAVECSTPLAESKRLCACGCGEEFGPSYTGRNRFKRGHYRFIPDQHTVDPDTGCWLWTGPIYKRSGRGIARNDRGVTEYAHRLYYEALVRALADDELLIPTCENPLCCSPDHMQVVTKSANQQRHARAQWERQLAEPDAHHIGWRADR